MHSYTKLWPLSFRTPPAWQQSVYLITLSGILCMLLLLPFVHLDVTIVATGIVHSIQEKADLLSPEKGRLIYINMTNHQLVKKGEVLLKLDDSLLERKVSLLNSRIKAAQRQYRDVELMLFHLNDTARINAITPTLHTNLLRSKWNVFYQQYRTLSVIVHLSGKSYLRHLYLYKRGAVSLSEIESQRLSNLSAINQQISYVNIFKAELEKEASQLRNELLESFFQQEEIHKQKSNYILVAPQDGIIHNIVGISPGTSVFAQQKLGEISPSGRLIVTSYVHSSEIGYIRSGQSVHLQVEIHHSIRRKIRIPGRVIDISPDAVLKGGMFYYKVRCMPTENLFSGQRSSLFLLRKGIAVRAYFFLSRKRLSHLLFSRIKSTITPILIAVPLVFFAHVHSYQAT